MAIVFIHDSASVNKSDHDFNLDISHSCKSALECSPQRVTPLRYLCLPELNDSYHFYWIPSVYYANGYSWVMSCLAAHGQDVPLLFQIRYGYREMSLRTHILTINCRACSYIHVHYSSQHWNKIETTSTVNEHDYPSELGSCKYSCQP